MLEVRFLVGNGRPSMLMFVRSAAALATMRPALLLRALKKAPRPSTSYHLVEKEYKCNAYTVYTPRMHVRKIPNNHQTLSPTALSSPCLRQVMSSVNDSNARRKTSLRHASTTIVSDPGPGAFSFTAS